MKLKLFTKKDCPNCPSAKKILKEVEDSGIPVEYYDSDDVDGLAEGSFYMIMATPSTLLVDDSGVEIDSWRGQDPDVGKIKEYFNRSAENEPNSQSPTPNAPKQAE